MATLIPQNLTIRKEIFSLINCRFKCLDKRCLHNCPCGQVDPVNPANGNYLGIYNDLNFPAPANSSIGLNVERTYNSQDTSVGRFGKGWHFTYDMSLLVTASNGITVVNPDGRRDWYTLNINRAYVAPSRANASLITGTVSGNLVYTLTTAAQVSYVFDNNGKLTQIKDRNANQIALNYTSSGISISDNYGRAFTVITTTNGRIVSISDGIRTVNYGYDSTYTYLKTVTDPRGPGFTVTYNYDANGLLNERYDQNNNLVMRNYYDSNRRVITQTLYPSPGVGYSSYFDYSQFGKTILTNARGYTTSFNIG